MAYVAPIGTIEFYQDVPLTSDYTDTIYFASESAQRAYFSGKLYARYTNQMYTRVHGNKIRVNTNAENMPRVNYLGFNNGRIAKWYYAFITGIEYVNEQVTEITYELDDLQTWFISARWHDCFIERQHSTTDEIGDNTQPEPLEVTDYFASKLFKYHNCNSIGYVLSIGLADAEAIGISSNPIFTTTKFGGYGTLVKYLYFGSASSLQAFLELCEFQNGLIKISSLQCQPISLYAVPAEIFGTNLRSVQWGSATINLVSENAVRYFFDELSAPDAIGEGPYYTPKNKKLLTYPFNLLKVSAGTKIQEYKFENFMLNGASNFVSYATNVPSPSIIIKPLSYEGDEDQYHYSITLDTFPSLPLYQNGVGGFVAGAMVKSAKTLGSMLVATLSQNVSTASGVGYVGLRNVLKEGINSTGALKSNSGGTDVSPIMADKSDSEPRLMITLQQFSLKREYAILYDKYLSKYGYAQNKVGRPNIHARTRWTYIKTRNCSVSGPIPAEAMKTISRVMDNGITWWSAGWTVGAYTNSSGELYDNPIA